MERLDVARRRRLPEEIRVGIKEERGRMGVVSVGRRRGWRKEMMRVVGRHLIDGE